MCAHIRNATPSPKNNKYSTTETVYNGKPSKSATCEYVCAKWRLHLTALKPICQHLLWPGITSFTSSTSTRVVIMYRPMSTQELNRGEMGGAHCTRGEALNQHFVICLKFSVTGLEKRICKSEITEIHITEHFECEGMKW